MNTKQKQYIEQNIKLIENNEWDEFFLHGPYGIGEVLYTAGIDFMSELKAVPQRCFAGSTKDNITIPDGVTSIEDYAFCNCEILTSITIPYSVTSIGDAAFINCLSLTNITIPDRVTSIGSHAFYYCRSLTRVTIGNGVTSIGEGAFSSCSSLTSITIPYSVASIGGGAFRDCSNLRIVRFTGTIEQWRNITLKKNTFIDVPVQEVLCSDGVTNLQ